MALIGLLAACGGGGAGGSGGAGGAAVQAPVLTVTARPIKTLAFDWTADARHTRFILLEDPDGAGPLAEHTLATLPAGTRTHTVEVFLPDRINAGYRLRACVDAMCTESATARPASLNPAIGFFKASNPAANDDFGLSLALSTNGRAMVVGAFREDGAGQGVDALQARSALFADSGAVYVFERPGDAWSQTAYIKPQVSLPGAFFGYSTAVSGDGEVMLVGAPMQGDGAAGSGAAYVFRRQTNGVWVQEQVIKAPMPQADAQFGYSVALSGDGEWAAVAQPHALGGGEVQIYRQTAGTWTLTAQLQGHNTEPGDGFGESLAVSADGTTLVAGAYGERNGLVGNTGTDNSTTEAGAAYVFVRDNAGVWQQTAYLKAPQPADTAWFGASVAVSGNGRRVVVGEPFNQQAGARSRAHVFEGDGPGHWTREASLAMPLDESRDAFGYLVSLSADGTSLAVAARYDPGNAVGLGGDASLRTFSNAGAVYLYRRLGAGSWSSPVYIKAPNNKSDLYFGYGLAMAPDGGTLAVYGGDSGSSSGIGGDQSGTSETWAGAVYLY